MIIGRRKESKVILFMSPKMEIKYGGCQGDQNLEKVL